MKIAAATANRDLGKLKAEIAEPIIKAAREVAEGKFDDQFPVDVYQTGSGTSSNMNANEVISNRAIEMTGGDRFHAKKPIHPNDHVNMGQSTNDMFPTAIHVAVGTGDSQGIDARPGTFAETCWTTRRSSGTTSSRSAARIWPTRRRFGWGRRSAASPGRSKLMRIASRAGRRSGRSNCPPAAPRSAPASTRIRSSATRWPRFWRRKPASRSSKPTNHFEANANRDGLVECSGQLRSIAVSLFSIANNIRWLGSGPRCGFYEIMLPDRQPGSSIMPGKVNPVMCESMMQVCARVMGNDQTIAFSGATGGQFQLNIMMPVMGLAALESVQLLASCTQAFVDFCALEMEANRTACEKQVEWSMAMVTSLNPLIGYDTAAAIAKEAFKTGKTVRDLCLEKIKAGTLKKKDTDVRRQGSGIDEGARPAL